MLDLSHILNTQRDIQIFYPKGITNPWQTWNKPRNCQWIWIMCIGGGAGGAGGLTNNVYFGSSGGGSGAVTRAMFNSYHLPDILFVQPGLGGSGGLPDNNGSSGNRSWVSISPSITSTNSILSSGTAPANFGFTSGSPGNGETAFTNAVSVFANLSTFQSISGGGSLVATQIPTSVTPLSSRIICQGAQGAGTDNVFQINGASILSTNISPLIAGGIGNSTGGDGGNGGDGYTSWSPFFSTGGAGGGNSLSGIGGMGGAGGIGSGGGAGGSGFILGGTGGRGGDGIVIIVAF